MIIDLPEDRLKFYCVLDGHGGSGRAASLVANYYFDEQIRKNSKKLRKVTSEMLIRFADR